MTTSINPQHTAEYDSQSASMQNANDSGWFWDDGVPGTGTKPDWLGDKYKSVAEKARAHSALEQRLGVAPKEYSLEKGESWIDPEYGPFQDMMETAKKNHVSQEVFDQMLESVSKYLDEFNVDYDEERGKLGEKAEERLQVLDNWAKSNFSPETYDALVNNLRTADAIKALEEVRGKMNNNTTQVPGTNMHETSPNVPSLQDIQSEMNTNIERYKKDPVYRKEMLGKMEMAAKHAGIQDKQAY